MAWGRQATPSRHSRAGFTSHKSAHSVSYVATMTPAELPLNEDDVAARVAAGELVPLTIDGTVPVRTEVLAQLRARAKQAAKERGKS